MEMVSFKNYFILFYNIKNIILIHFSHLGSGDVCDRCAKGKSTDDVDGDQIPDVCDNCVDSPNPEQEDVDHDG